MNCTIHLNREQFHLELGPWFWCPVEKVLDLILVQLCWARPLHRQLQWVITFAVQYLCPISGLEFNFPLCLCSSPSLPYLACIL